MPALVRAAQPSSCALLPSGQRVANSRDGEDPPSILEGDLWPGLSGELSPGSQEPPVTHGEPTLAVHPAGRERAGPSALICPGDRQCRGFTPSRGPLPHPQGLPGSTVWPGGRIRSDQPQSLAAPRQAGTPQNNSRKKSLKPVKQPKSTRAPMLTAGAPRQGMFSAYLPVTVLAWPGLTWGPLGGLLLAGTWEGSGMHQIPRGLSRARLPCPAPPVRGPKQLLPQTPSSFWDPSTLKGPAGRWISDHCSLWGSVFPVGK